jgi:hypothetical protein
VHCAAAPFFLTALSLAALGGLLETGLVCLSFLTAAATVCSGFRVHQRVEVFFGLGVAACLFLVRGFLPEGGLETVLIVAAGLVLAATHWANRRYCKTCRALTGAQPLDSLGGE